jgi:hypothetical protein
LLATRQDSFDAWKSSTSVNEVGLPRRYLAGLDWLKAAGIVLIVHGHVAAATVGWSTAPIYPKQLGVAFFVCAMGSSLALERRASWRVVYNRSFEVLLFGLACALLMSAIGAIFWADLVESNYLPLALGSNVFMDAFPANPTTWYIGTYLHLLLLWALLLRQRRITAQLIALSVVLEIAIRALLVATGHLFPAYVLLTNWSTLLLIGLAFGQCLEQVHHPWAWRFALAGLALLWPFTIGNLGWMRTFPLMTPAGSYQYFAGLVTSLAVSLAYLSYTALAYMVAQHLPALRVVRFLARNTLIIFIAHMPLYYLLEWLLHERIPSYAPRVAIEFAICLFGLALASEWLRGALKPVQYRDRLADSLSARFPGLAMLLR